MQQKEARGLVIKKHGKKVERFRFYFGSELYLVY